MHNGGFVLSKRLSRLMRPYFASAFFPRETVSIQYLERDEHARTRSGMGRGGCGVRSCLRVLDAMLDLPPANIQPELAGTNSRPVGGLSSR